MRAGGWRTLRNRVPQHLQQRFDELNLVFVQLVAACQSVEITHEAIPKLRVGVEADKRQFLLTSGSGMLRENLQHAHTG